jgi:hypothetical protein
MSNWVSWNELLNQGIKNFEILDYLKEGLQPYSRPDIPIYCPCDYHRYTYLNRKLTRFNNLIKEFEKATSSEKIFSEGTEFFLDYYLRETFDKYNRKVAAKDRIDIQDVSFDFYGQFAKLCKFIKYLEKKRVKILKEMEKIFDDDPNLDGDQKKLSWKYFIVPNSEEKYNNIVLRLENAFFKKEDVKTIQNNKTTEQDKTKVFPCNPGTKWDQIEIALLPAGEKFFVKTPIGRGYFDHIDLELFDRRKKSSEPLLSWGFLIQLAKKDGFFPLEGVQRFEQLASNAKELNKRLKKVFRINNSIYTDRCDLIGGYKVKFKISQISDNDAMIRPKSLIDEELENPKYSALKENLYYPEHSTFKNE